MTLNQWNGGFVASVRVTAGSTAVSTRWTVSIALPSAATETHTWNAGTNGSTGTA